MRALQAAGWPGRIVPVNPAGGEIRGIPVFRSLEEAPGPIDLALVCTPAGTVVSGESPSGPWAPHRPGVEPGS